MSTKKSDNITLKDSMSKISEALGTTYEESIDKINDQLTIIEDKKSELATKVADPNSLILEDQLELRDGLKNLIRMNTEMLEILKSDIRVGSNNYAYTSASLLTGAISNLYRELRECNQFISTSKQKCNQLGFGDMSKNDTIELTTNQLSDMLTKAREKNSMNEIKVDFKIE